MEMKQQVKLICDLCIKGDFEKALNIVNNGCRNKVDTNSGMKIVISCCNVCVSSLSNPDNISEDKLLHVLKIIVPSITDPDESQLLSYIQSMYYILKLLIVKNCYELIIGLENMLLPFFLPLTLPKKHSDTYHSIVKTIYNIVAKSSMENERERIESLFLLSLMVSRLCTKVLDPVESLKMSYNCFLNLVNLKISVDNQIDFYTKVMELMDGNRIQPKMEEYFNCVLNLLSYTFNNILETFNFERAAEFYCQANALGAVTSKHEEYAHLYSLLRFPLIMSPLELENKICELIKCNKSLKKLTEIWEISNNKQQIGNKLYMLLFTVINYYKTEKSEDLREFSEDLQLEILHFIANIASFESETVFQCSCGCSVRTNIFQGFRYVQVIATLLNIYATHAHSISSSYHKKSCKLLRRFCEDVEFLKQHQCEKWQNAWNIFGIKLYNIGMQSHRNSDQGALVYLNLLIKYFIKLEGKNGTILPKFSILSGSLSIICNINLKDYDKFMAFTALAIFLCPNQRGTFISNWISAKHKQRELKTPNYEQVQKITLSSAFKIFEKDMACVTDSASLLNDADKIDLLIFELEQYKIKWRSKVPMMAAFRELCELADLDTIAEVIADIFGDSDLLLHDNILETLNDILRRYERKVDSSDNPVSKVYLAFLHYLHYKYRVKDTISKNADEMERTMSVVPIKSDTPDPTPRDPNEECDVVSSYPSLELDQYVCDLKYLNKSLTIISSAISEASDNFQFGKITPAKLYDILIKISHEYRLHRHRVKSLQALELALKIAQIEKDVPKIIEATGFIIEKSDISKSYFRYLALMADKYLQELDVTAGPDLNIILSYYICRINACLYSNFKESHKIYKIARDLLDAQEGKAEFNIVKSQLFLLSFKFVSLPCSFEIEDHKENTLIKIHQAVATIFGEYSNGKINCPYELSVLLDINKELTKLYHFFKSPREVRAFCKETLILTQKLVLPLRSASYLMYLSHADLQSNRLEDCQIKINGMADILCLAKHTLQMRQKNNESEFEKLNCDIDCVTNDVRDIALDLPQLHAYKQYSQSSPQLVVQTFQPPSFTKHKSLCDCFYCICFEYQELVLQKNRLEALINIKQNNVVAAQDFFEGVLSLFENYCQRYEFYSEIIAQFISNDLVPEFSKEYLSAYGYILLNYSSHLMRTKNKTEAVSINNKLIDLLFSRKIEYVYLYNEALVQKLGYLTQFSAAEPLQELQAGIENMSLDKSPKTAELSRTPESKHNMVTFTINATPKLSTPKINMKKCLFDLSPTQVSSDTAGNKKMSAAGTSKSREFSVEKKSSKKENFRTAASKIHIYSGRGKPKKQREEAQVCPPASTGDAGSPVHSTKIEASMKPRTRLLTEKLKQTSKNSDAENICQNNSQNNSDRTFVRKNLLTELASSENTHSGAIRKSKRNKK